MFVQVVYLQVDPQKLEQFKQEALANARASLKEAGVIRFDVLAQHETPTKFMFYEMYHTREDLEKHMQTPHFKRWVEFGVPTLLGERVRVIYTCLTDE